MCGANKRFFLYLLLAFLLASAAGVLRAGESDMQVYLISETELLSIEEYKTKSEAEKRAWLLQVQELKIQAAGLQRESETLNSQLRNQRDQTRMLQKSFNEYETENLMTISMKNGEIADLKQAAAGKALEAAAYTGIARSRLIIIIALAGSWIVFIAFKACRFFRLF
jgi:predicted RNase H-like nuclease (RuvC/YqgF family)